MNKETNGYVPGCWAAGMGADKDVDDVIETVVGADIALKEASIRPLAVIKD